MATEDVGQEDRRAFLGRTGKAALMAPAAALLLSAASKDAMAIPYGQSEKGRLRTVIKTVIKKVEDKQTP